MAEKTNAARILDRLKIPYSIIEYNFDPEDLAAEHVAEELGEPIESVYKTLVLRGDKTGVFVCVIAGNLEVDLKKAAKISGNKKVEMIPMKELQPLTGYIRGGCTAIGMKKNFPVYLSEDALSLTDFYVSAGKRGAQIKIATTDYIKATNANTGDITKSKL